LGKKANMRNCPQSNAFATYQDDDGQYLLLVETAPLTEPFSSADGPALSPPGRAAANPAYVVLAVDHDERARLNTVAMLEVLGHTVFQAHSGEQALEVLRREPAIDLVVTDMAMPLMSGLDLCSVAQSLYPSLRFVLATGAGEAPDCEEPTLLRLSKPFLQFDLARVIEIAMEMAPWSPQVIWL
jgi:CheY-like chemotaxis protein